MKRFTTEAFGDLKQVCAAAVSPDGRHAVYAVAGQDLARDRDTSHLWLCDLETGENRQLTYGGAEGCAVWRDDQTILFSALRDEEDVKTAQEKKPVTVYYELSLAGGEARRAFSFALSGARLFRLAGGRWLVFGVYFAMPEEDRESALCTVYDEYPYHVDSRGIMNKKRDRLYVYDEASEKLTPVTGEHVQACPVMGGHGEPFVSPDGRFVYYWAHEAGAFALSGSGVYRYEVETGENRLLAQSEKYEFSAITACGETVWLLGVDLRGKYCDADLLCVPAEGGALQTVCVPDETVTQLVIHNGAPLLLAQEHNRTNLFALRDGALTRVCLPDRFVSGALLPSRGALYAVASRHLGVTELVRIGEDGVCRELTRVGEPFFAAYAVSPSEGIFVRNRAGIELAGWVIRPYGYEPGKQYPGMLVIHGGPHGNYTDQFMPQFQRFAAEGYFVFYCNPRGSNAYGRAFSELSGCYGTYDYEDIMDFTDGVLAQYPDIDGDRLGVGGISYGGYMTNWIITHTDRFKAAASQRSVVNWETMYTCCDIACFVESGQGGTPWRNAEALRRASPIQYAENVKTPTLFLQAGADYRCPVEEAEQMFTALLARGVPTRMLVFHGASHMQRTPLQARRNDDEILAWMDKYVK